MNTKADKNNYYTFSGVAEGIFTDKGSKFIGYSYPISDQEELKQIIKELQKKHPQARHFCWASIVGKEESVERSSDDGEPSGTAGKPILNQLLSHQLQNACIVVVRYFGGTLLGTSGLINAYKQGAIESIIANTIIQKEITYTKIIGIPYEKYVQVMQLFKTYDITYTQLETTNTKISFKLEIGKKNLESFEKKVVDLDI